MQTTKRNIKATPNYSARTFTIRDEGLKYRTNKMDRESFNVSLNRTSNDWANWLKYSNDYYIVK